jgi:sugar lactone lactonase YvrE
MTPFDTRPCTLGEGPLWHPERHQLLWCDITAGRLLSREDDAAREWAFPVNVSAMGWIDRDRLLVASEVALHEFDISDGASRIVAPLDANNTNTRSNDGRADPWGGFWIGTMGKAAEPGAGAIWRYWRGEVRQMYPGITIPNAISFTPGGRYAHFADSAQGKVWRVALSATDGWPEGEPEVFLDFAGRDGVPDGAVVDAEGYLWLAVWGEGCVAVHDANGQEIRRIPVPAPHTTCPAFGGPGLATLYVTSARQGLSDRALMDAPLSGQTFAIQTDAVGQPEHQVLL